MRSTTIMIAVTCIPGALAAQQASASASANAQATVHVPASYSAESKTSIEAAFRKAHDRAVPDQPLRQRMAEGQAKGASDAQVAVAVQRAEARLEASQSAMVRAGRRSPSADEITAGEQAMARGASEGQVEALARRAPSDRSMVVAFDVLAKLEAEGRPVDKALAVVGAKLDARAGDDALIALTGSAASASAAHVQGAGAHGANAASGAGATAAAAGAVNGAAGVAGVAGSVTGGLSGALGATRGSKKP